MHDVTLIVSHVKQNAAMRVGPDPFRYGSFQRDPLVRLIRHAGAVVSGQGRSHDQEANGQDRGGNENSPQVGTSVRYLACRLEKRNA
jgi:hypothetical protein